MIAFSPAAPLVPPGKDRFELKEIS